MIMNSPNATAASVHHFLFASVTSPASILSHLQKLVFARLALANISASALTAAQRHRPLRSPRARLHLSELPRALRRHRRPRGVHEPRATVSELRLRLPLPAL